MAAKVMELPDTVDGFFELIEAVDKKNPEKDDIQKLREFLQGKPAIWAFMGDMAHMSATHLIDNIQAQKSVKLSIEASWVKLQEELGKEKATRLEKLLIQQVVLSWIRLGIVDYKYTSTVEDGKATINQADYWERRLNAAQRRFLRACSTLARVRKMNLPAIQVNIAEKQVNQVNTK